MDDVTLRIGMLAGVYFAGGFWVNRWVTKHGRDRAFGKIVTWVTAPACLLVLFVAATFSLVVLPLVVAAHANRERKFVATMKDRGRFREWGEIEKSPADGTLIIEQAQKDGCRVWWTSENVAGITPHPVPEEADLDYFRIQAPLPFVEWCAERYTSPSGGRALLTEMPFPSPFGFLTTDFLRTKTSIANMIATVKVPSHQN